MYKQTNRLKDIQAGRKPCIYTYTGRQTYLRENRQAGTQESSQTCIQRGRQTSREACTHTGTQVGI